MARLGLLCCCGVLLLGCTDEPEVSYPGVATAPVCPAVRVRPFSGLVDAATEGVQLRDVTDEKPTFASASRSSVAGRWASMDMFSGGAAFRDVDGDEVPDIVLARTGDSEPALQGVTFLRGQGDGTFADATEAAGLDYRGPAFGVSVADFDGNGMVDLFVAVDRAGDRLFAQLEPGSFEEVGRQAGIRREGRRSRSVALLDYDADGWVDIYVVTWRPLEGIPDAPEWAADGHWVSPNTLYRNLGDGTFEDVTESAGGVACHGRSSLGVAAADFDGDADTDIYVTNDFFHDCLYRNEGDGTFTEITAEAGVGTHAGHGMGVASGDPDADGDLDIFVTDDLWEDDSIGNAFYWNEGAMRFESGGVEAGVDGGASVGQRSAVYWGCGFRDFDHDATVELHMTQQDTGLNRIYSFDAETRFFSPIEDARFTSDADARGSAFADYDDDGREDLLLVARGGPARLFRNEGAASGGAVRVRVVGTMGNSEAVGSIVRVTACGRTQTQTILSNEGYLSSSDPRVTFGLGGCAHVDEVEVIFPDGERRTASDVPAGNEVTVCR